MEQSTSYERVSVPRAINAENTTNIESQINHIISKEVDRRIEKTLQGLVGAKIYFPENNNLSWECDHQFYRNVPNNLEFTVVATVYNCLILSGDGYGSDRNYGNGCICVSLAYADSHASFVSRDCR